MKILVGKRTIEVEDYKEICDGCGREFGFPSEDRSWFVEADALVQFSFGYSSSHDREHGDFTFCPKCADGVWDVLKTLFPQLKLTEDCIL